MWWWLVACGGGEPAAVVAPPVLDVAPEPAVEAPPPEVGCVAPGPACTCPGDGVEPGCFDRFDGAVKPLSEAQRAAMTGVSWREGCPVGLDDLAVLDLPRWGEDGAVHRGELVVAAEVADAVLGVFGALYDARFPIARMEPVHRFGGSDDASMAANNTSAFNCRPISGGTSWSEHSYGRAVDLNPLVNPYVRGARVLPPEGAPYADRAQLAPGGVGPDGPAVAAFAAIGWKWGGNWRSYKDYQHFSESGR